MAPVKLDRNQEDVDNLLHLAKISKSELLPTSEALFFKSANAEDRVFYLLELNKPIHAAIKNGQPLAIKGTDEDEAVICTDEQTFQIRNCETSNSLLLAKPTLHFDDIKHVTEEEIRKVEICTVLHSYWEIFEGLNSHERLFKLLRPTEFDGIEKEKYVDKNKMFTEEELLNALQCSKAEYHKILSESTNIHVIDGYVRLLNFECQYRLVVYMVNVMIENSWELDQLDFETIYICLKDFAPHDLIVGLFNKYTEPSIIVNNFQKYRFHTEKVCQILARGILKTSETHFEFDEFMEAWREVVPPGMVPTEDMLYGIAVICENANNKRIIRDFPADNVPGEVNAFFETIFTIKSKWTLPEMKPYLLKVAGERGMNGLLHKYTRCYTVDGVRYYSSKHR